VSTLRVRQQAALMGAVLLTAGTVLAVPLAVTLRCAAKLIKIAWTGNPYADLHR